MSLLRELMELIKNEGLAGPLSFWLKFRIGMDVVSAVISIPLFFFILWKILKQRKEW